MRPFSRSCETLTTPRLLLVRALLTASFTSACWAVLQHTSMNTPNKVSEAIADHINRLVELVLPIVSLLIHAECSAVDTGRCHLVFRAGFHISPWPSQGADCGSSEPL